MMNKSRWLDLMEQWGIGDNQATCQKLITAYSEPGRHYHTVDHVSHCLSEFDAVRAQLRHPPEVELALWFHDAVYRPYASGNEEKSADWAAQFLGSNGCDDEAVQRIRAHIMATLHDAPAQGTDTATLVDIDLSILGTDPNIYDQFERNVRREYRWVPRPLYRRKRSVILQSFLDRAAIYQTKPFADRLEQPARRNLQRAIAQLA